ncbi:unnamed protein product [Musa acuminata subsp. malaccensis]|uniref:(wild Malaysian banana) hypothetical protein n=1 Tax=Musa acuminata subsp. malaccensis TaxID=214687 RepID=A0A8D7F5C5_MUSAM|nr:unnamed protein product [Musa acuminata subsp. malaccensis]
MNFLIRTAQPVVPEVSTVVEPEHQKAVRPIPKPAATLEGLIAEETFSNHSIGNDALTDSEQVGFVGSSAPGSTSKNQFPVGNHTDVSDDDGWITIPYKELPDNWADAADIQQLRSLDRSFIFPGSEHIQILVCLSASKHVSEVITPFRVAAVMSKNGKSSPNKEQHIETLGKMPSPLGLNGLVSSTPEKASGQKVENNIETVSAGSVLSPQNDISATESLLHMEQHKQQIESILQSFRNSNFFVRIAEADEQLWSKRNVNSSMNSEVVGGKSHPNDGSKKVPRCNVVSAIVDKGSFDGITSGGVARNTVRCYSLSNGDVVVLLEVNVGVSNLKDAVLEVIQFEKYRSSNSAFENHNNLLVPNKDDPYWELLDWLLPLDRTLPPRSLSPPLSSSISQKPTYPASGSQFFSFSHFRSYSMSSLPQVTGPPSSATSFSNSKPAFDPEDFDRFSSEKLTKNQDTGNERLLSFRGVSLEPERFSTHCGLDGIYLPGRRWRRKLEIIQPLQIRSFAAECNTEDVLCVQIKNVSPAHIPDIVIYLDAITIVAEEEASKEGRPLYLPIASIDAGNDHNLPSLALRRGEEHSFILKLASAINGDSKGNGEIMYSRTNAAPSNTHMMSNSSDGMMVSCTAKQFAILVSCHCNYTESKLFFKQLTDWRPHIARDLMISIASETHKQSDIPNSRAPQLPVKVLTLKATNLTTEDLTFTVLAPEIPTSPSVLSLSSTPRTPMNSHATFHDYVGSSVPIATKSQKESCDDGKTSSSVERTAMMSDVILSNSAGFTHLWLQSAVPLGCIPARSSATVKLELLPLTDGIITLDTLQIAVKEKGLTFVPEHSLKIHATSSIATGIL